MMRENMRLYATLAIWFAFMVMTTVIFVASNVANSGDPNTPVFIALVLALAASISTVAVWVSALFDRPSHANEAQAKRKRFEPGRLERLVQALDDDELDRLETLLLAREETDEQHRRQGR